MKQYLNLLRHVLDNGVKQENRTGIDTLSDSGWQMQFHMADGFPVVTTKKLFFKSVKAELLWFIKGSQDVKELQALGSRIWDANAEADYWKPKAAFEGDLGRVYGVQWRRWRGSDGQTTDQLAKVIQTIKENPDDRRMIVSAWNPGELDQMALPPCHCFFKFSVLDGKLNLHLFQRSCDLFLGVGFNIASYSMLLHMVAQVTGLTPGKFIHSLDDIHIYENHIDQVKEQLTREPLPLPTLWLNPEIKNIDDFTMDDIKLVNYQHHPAIKAEMAV